MSTLPSGTRLGPYEILGVIGAGGMGEVYRAHDPRVGRDVAIKVSAQQFGERFEREVRAIASLNHPNICTLFDVGPNYLVMELVEGEAPKGPIPVEQALKYARQIAAALEYAHEKGVVHRDLKPGNIKIKTDGTVKVLDFGLAKVTSTVTGDVENSPTISMAATQAGVILGTAAYMPPEQARGKPVDKRADVWAFGCVLYELLSGDRTFGGDTVVDILGAVVNREPNWRALPPGSPVTTLKRCLEKDVKLRLRDIGDAVLEPEVAPAAETQNRWRMWALTGTLAVIALAAVAFALWNRTTPVSKAVVRLSISLPPGQEITDYPAISPDGQTIAYVTQQGTDEPQLYLRNLSSFEAKPVPGSSGSLHHDPFFSPDGKWVAFFAQGQLKKVEVAGGSPIKVADIALPFGGSWNDDDTIVFVGALNSGLLRVPASGAKPEQLTKPDGGSNGYAHVFPQWLPGGRRIIFSVWGQNHGPAILSLDTHEWKLIKSAADTGYDGTIFAGQVRSTGHLLDVDASASILASPFDASQTQAATTKASVLSDVYYAEEDGRPFLAASKNGTVVYAPGNPGKRSIVRVSRDGKIEPTGKTQGIFAEVALSPDGAKVISRQAGQLWIHDLNRGTATRLTLPNSGSNFQPRWSRDGKTVLFGSNRDGNWDIYSQPADGSRPAEVLLKKPYDQFPLSVAPDGTLLYLEGHPVTGSDLWALSPDGKTSPVRVTPSEDSSAELSPDGRWLAFESNESGRSEIYAQRFPSGENKIPISSGGGREPRWSRGELFYIAGDAVMSVAVQPDGSFGRPKPLFDRSGFLFGYFHSYDVSPDGKTFLMIQRDPGSVPRQLNVILNWSEELDRLAPAEKK